MHFIAFVSPVQQVLPNALGANGEADIRWGTQKYSFSISCPKQLVRGIWIKTHKSKEQMQTARNADVCTYMEKGFFLPKFSLLLSHYPQLSYLLYRAKKTKSKSWRKLRSYSRREKKKKCEKKRQLTEVSQNWFRVYSIVNFLSVVGL